MINFPENIFFSFKRFIGDQCGIIMIIDRVKYTKQVTILLYIFCYRRHTIGRLLRRSLERWSIAWLRIGAAMRLPFPRNCFPACWFCLAISYSHGDEARRYKDWQTREANDTYRYLLCALYCTCTDRDRLSLLRAGIFRSMDAYVEYGDVLTAGSTVPLLTTVSSRWAYSWFRS